MESGGSLVVVLEASKAADGVLTNEADGFVAGLVKGLRHGSVDAPDEVGWHEICT